MELTDEQWTILEPLIPEPARREDGKGRPRREPRAVLEGICWILRTGAQWADLPERYPPYQTCHRRFQEWERNGVLRQILETLAQDLEERGELDLSECFIDGTFVAAKKGAQRLVRLNGAKVAKSWQYRCTKFEQSVRSWYLSRPARYICFTSIGVTRPAPSGATMHEVRLVHETLASRHVSGKPEKLIGDKAYDSDPLDVELADVGIDMIAPHRRNHKKVKTQDGRKLRRYKRR